MACTLIAFGVAVNLPELSDHYYDRCRPHPPGVAGLWRTADRKHALTIEVKTSGELILREADSDSSTSEIGEIVGQASPNGEGNWIGKHVWGGGKQPPVQWGEVGGLLIRRISEQELFVQYTDSKYKGGWTYLKW